MGYDISTGSDYLYVARPWAGIHSLPVTFSCWFNAPNTIGTGALMSAASDGSDARDTSEHYITLRLGPAGSVRADNDNASWASLAGPYTANTWTHAVATFDTASKYVWLDGVKSSEETTAQALNVYADQFAAGAVRESIVHTIYSGLIAECCWWHRILSDDEIGALYNGGVGLSPLFISTEQLGGWWPLRSGDSQINEWQTGVTDAVGDWSLSGGGGGGSDADSHPPMIYTGGAPRLQYTSEITIRRQPYRIASPIDRVPRDVLVW